MSKWRRRRRRRRILAAILVLAIVGILYAGLSAEDAPDGIITTNYGAPKKRTSWIYQGVEVTQEEWEFQRSMGLKRVSKYIEAGIIQRINEAHRQLFINDPVWFAMGIGRQEHVVRVVVGYLDVVNENNPGTVTVFSFRTGGAIADLKAGTFTAFR